MTIYKIDGRINELLSEATDPETGELNLDEAAFDALQMERERKVEAIALAFKNAQAEAEAIKAEISALQARAADASNTAERIKKLLEYALQGETFSTPRVAVTYRASSAVELDAEFNEWAAAYKPELLRYKEPEADKKAIRAAIKDGQEFKYARMVTAKSMSIK